MKRRFFLCLLLTLLLGAASLPTQGMPIVATQPPPAGDSLRWVAQLEKMRLADSIKRVQDSLAMQYIGLPHPNRPNRFADSLRNLLIVENGDFMGWIAFTNHIEMQRNLGDERHFRDPWIIVAIGLLFLFLGVIRAAFPNEVVAIIQAFYNDRMLLQINKEDTLYSSWPFIFLYILFGFVTGMFLYHYNLYFLQHKQAHGPNVFIGISIFVIVLFVLKIIVTRFLGFVFDLQRMVREYVSILYLSYFNAALVFLPVVLAISLLPERDTRWVIPAGLVLVLLLLIFRLVKTTNNLLSSYRFSKFYLFMYLCCLEIAPVLILIKVLDN